MMRNIKELSIAEITDFVSSLNEKPFRAKQIYEWLWKKNVSSFDEMKNVSNKITDALKSSFEIKPLKITYSVKSSIDNSSKFAFLTHDKLFIEGVLIPSEGNKRVTACISTQVGCSLGCKFCATGTMGLTRNLTASEIYEQVFLLNVESEKNYQRKLTNIVVMGMGEPLLNYDNLLRALNFVTGTDGLSMSASRITVSTVGLVKQIKKLADDEPKFNLAVSLHTARNEQRSEIMPVNIHNPVPELITALKYFNEKTGKRITFEYLLIDGITDTKADALALAEFCKNFPSKINLIEYNPVQHVDYKTSKPFNALYFKEFLEKKNLIVTLRKSKGQDINAACGQLALIKQNKK